jgi:glycine C-acetyltransferase
MVDEAHSLGVLGARGLGVQEHFGLAPEAIDIKMGTLSKTIPSAGGYIAGRAELIAALRHNVRPFIFSGAPTPPMVAAAMAGFEILLSQPERVRKLHANIRRFRDGLRRIGLTPPDTGTAIIPLPCRDEESAFTFAKRCLADGLYVTPIVFPAVPQNAPRIRATLTAALSEADIALALGVIGRHRALLA